MRERRRLADEEDAPPLEAVRDSAPDEAEEERRQPAGAREQGDVEDLAVLVRLLHPERLGDELHGRDEADERRPEKEQAVVAMAERAEGRVPLKEAL